MNGWFAGASRLDLSYWMSFAARSSWTWAGAPLAPPLGGGAPLAPPLGGGDGDWLALAIWAASQAS